MRSEGWFRIFRHYLFYSGVGASLGSLTAVIMGFDRVSGVIRQVSSLKDAAQLTTIMPTITSLLEGVSVQSLFGARVGMSVGVGLAYVSARIKFGSDGARRSSKIWLLLFAGLTACFWTQRLPRLLPAGAFESLAGYALPKTKDMKALEALKD